MKKTFIRILAELFRHHISLMLAITLINIYFIATGEDLVICFSVLLPQELLTIGLDYLVATGIPVFNISTAALITIVFILYVLCVVFSYNDPRWIIVGAVMTALDSVVGIYFLVTVNDTSYYLDLMTHAYVILALIAGYIVMMIAKRRPDKAPDTEPIAEPITEPITEPIAESGNEENIAE